MRKPCPFTTTTTTTISQGGIISHTQASDPFALQDTKKRCMSIATLSVETLEAITFNISTSSDLLSMALTCHQLRLPSQRSLFRYPNLSQADPHGCQLFFDSLQFNKVHLETFVRGIKIDFQEAQKGPCHVTMGLLQRVLPHMGNLRSLHLTTHRWSPPLLLDGLLPHCMPKGLTRFTYTVCEFGCFSTFHNAMFCQSGPLTPQGPSLVGHPTKWAWWLSRFPHLQELTFITARVLWTGASHTQEAEKMLHIVAKEAGGSLQCIVLWTSAQHPVWTNNHNLKGAFSHSDNTEPYRYTYIKDEEGLWSLVSAKEQDVIFQRCMQHPCSRIP